MTAKHNAADMARKLAERAGSGQARTVGATAINTKNIRTTFDLAPTLWAELQSWVAAAQADTRKKIKVSAVYRELLTLLLEDPDVADKVRARLAHPQAE